MSKQNTTGSAPCQCFNDGSGTHYPGCPLRAAKLIKADRAELIQEYMDWCHKHAFVPIQSADEAILNDGLSHYERQYLNHFIQRWDALS